MELSNDCGFLVLVLSMRNLLHLVVTQKVKTWTQGIVRAQRNESNRCITKYLL